MKAVTAVAVEKSTAEVGEMSKAETTPPAHKPDWMRYRTCSNKRRESTPRQRFQAASRRRDGQI
jgi:hypothetical protein